MATVTGFPISLLIRIFQSVDVDLPHDFLFLKRRGVELTIPDMNEHKNAAFMQTTLGPTNASK